MDQFKDFQGKDLDECIKQACDYFDLPREKLEIEIVQDAKSGIFGIVGARKAKIRARRAQLRQAVENLLGPEQGRHKPAPHSARQEKPREKPRQKKPAETVASSQPAEKKTPVNQDQQPEKHKSHHHENVATPESVQTAFGDTGDEMEETPFQELDKERLETLVMETISTLVSPIAGREVTVIVDLGHGRARAKVEWEGDAGLLIGREGQTLAALQYLASRIISRAMNAGVRVQLEIGDYKSRQDEKIREIARGLAEKVRQTGRSWSTRPLSSYHRRLVHMTLQDEAGIVTHSSGEGPLKRVVIAPRREQEQA